MYNRIKGRHRQTTALKAWVQRWLLVWVVMAWGIIGWGQTNNYFGTSGTISGNVWSTNPAGPYTSAINSIGGTILNFNNSGFNATGATLSPMPAIWNFGANVGTWTGTGTIGAAGINVEFNVSPSVLMDFGGSQAFSNSATAAFTKNGTGALGFVGNTFGGGLTLNAGTLILRGVNACGGGVVNLNGGTIAANANRAIVAPTSISINGDIQFGEIPANVSLASNTANISFSDNIALGSSVRTLTLGNAANHTFNGTISGSGGITFAANANGSNGVFTLANGNSYTGLTRLTGGTVQGTGESMFGANPGVFTPNQITFDGGTLRASTGNIDFDSNRGLTLGTGGGTFDVATGRTITLTNVVTGSGALTKTGVGLLLMVGAHTYTGSTIINGGIVQLNRTGGGTLPATNEVTINNGGSLRVSTNQTLNGLTLNTGATLTVDAGVTLTITGTLTYNGGTISSTGSMAYAGTGIIIYNGNRTPGIEWTNTNNPYAVTINGTAIVTLGADAATPGDLNINNTARLTGTGLTLTVGGDWNVSSTNATAYTGGTNAASLVILNGSGTRTFTHTGGATFRNLTFSGTGNYTINDNINISVNTLTISGGIVNVGTNTLSGSGSLVMSGGTLQLAKLAVILPELTGTAYNITGGTIELNGAGDQVLRGGIAYNNLVFSGISGIKTLSNAISSLASVTINGANILDVENRTFGEDITNFSMTNGRFRLRGTGTKPDMGGTYNLTGGVVEFYNSLTTRQSIRNNSYQNIEVTGANVGNSNGTITLNSGGSFTIKAGGTFDMNANAIAGPIGSQTVTVENGGIFNCGNVEGLVGPIPVFPNPAAAIRNDIENIVLEAGSTINYTREIISQKFTARNDYSNVAISGGGEKIVQGPSMIAGILTLMDGIVTTTATTPLTLTPSATTSGGSTNSFVNGPMHKVANDATDDFAFPIGKSGSPNRYRPVTIADFDGAGELTFTAEYFPTGASTHPRDQILGPELVGVWLNQYWQVSKSPGDLAARVGVPYTSGADGWFEVGPGSNSRVGIARFNGTHWDFTKDANDFDDIGPDYFESRGVGETGMVFSDRLSTFSPFTIGHGLNSILVLPIKLLAFEALQQKNNARLSWQVEDEQLLQGFVLEYSTNGTDFSRAATLQPNGTGHYRYLHALAPGMHHYYRLGMRQHNGTLTYSKVVSLVGAATGTNITAVGPNPVVGHMLIIHSQSATGQWLQATLIDATGRTLASTRYTLAAGVNKNLFTLPALASGYYTLLITTRDGTQVALPLVK